MQATASECAEMTLDANQAAQTVLVRYIADSYKRRVTESLLVGLAVLVAVFAAVVHRGDAAQFCLGGSLFVVVSEVIYSGNMWMGRTMFKSLEHSPLHRYGNAAFALFFGAAGTLVIGQGILLLVLH
jgi:threonine/homoserine/homoserine lactone efflux protein